MRNFLASRLPASVLTVVAMSLASVVFAAPPAGRNWTMVFNDEFDGTALDQTKWDTLFAWGLQVGWQEVYLKKNLIVDSGMCKMRMQRETYQGQPYTSAALLTKKEFKYGYFECRGKLPAGTGVWPAFWIPQRYGYELDFMEFLAGDPYTLYTTLHIWPNRIPSKPGGSHQQYGPAVFNAGVDLTKDFHVIGAEWKNDGNNTVDFYFDGVKRNSQTAPFFMGVDIPAQSLNLCIQANTGVWGPAIDNSVPMPVYWTVDYVRIYQESGSVQTRPREGLAGARSRISPDSWQTSSAYDIQGRLVKPAGTNVANRHLGTTNQGVLFVVPAQGSTKAAMTVR